MLILARKLTEGVIVKVGNEVIRVVVCDIVPQYNGSKAHRTHNHKVRLGFQASEHVKILREELLPREPSK